jgi:gluconolactonase
MSADLTTRGMLVALVTASLIGLAAARGQTPDGTPFRIERLHPALDDVVAADARLELLGDRFALTEGPVWVRDGEAGSLLFSDNAANVIYRWAAGRPLSVFLERSGYTGTDVSRVGAQTLAGRVPILLIGSNGLALDPQGRLIVTAMNDRTVYRLEKDGTRTTLADRFEGKRFNGPNDIVVTSNGAIYFTDSVWGLRDAAKDAARELPFSGFFLVKDGAVTLLGGDRDAPGMFPNGITVSPDERALYVTAGARRTMRYDIAADGGVTNGRMFVEHGSDGMKVDERGNLYTTSGGTPGVVQITSPAGVPLGRLHLPQPTTEPRSRVCATNVAFGDEDNRALYITACTHLFKIRLRMPGIRPAQPPPQSPQPLVRGRAPAQRVRPCARQTVAFGLRPTSIDRQCIDDSAQTPSTSSLACNTSPPRF